jgi:hypothetical protein
MFFWFSRSIACWCAKFPLPWFHPWNMKKKNNAISVYMSNYTTTHKCKYTTMCYNFSMSSAMYISKTKGGSHGFTGLFRTTNPYSVILT